MTRLALWLGLAACAPAPLGPAADGPAPIDAPSAPPAPRPAAPFRGVDCLPLAGAPRRHLQRGPDGAVWLERWRLRPAPAGPAAPALLGALVRVDPTTGLEEPVLTDILVGHLAGAHLVALRAGPSGRILTLADPHGRGEHPLTPATHPVTSHALADGAVLYTTPDGALRRRRFAAIAPDHLADGVAAVHLALPGGAALVTVTSGGAPELAVLGPGGAHPLAVPPAPATLSGGHVLIASQGGPRRLDPGARETFLEGHVPNTIYVHPLTDLPADLEVLPGGLLAGPGALLGPDLTARARLTGAPIADAIDVPGGLWALVRHDTDGDGACDALRDEADLCRIERDAPDGLHLPVRDHPRRLAAAWPALARLATGDLADARFTREGGVLVARAPGPGPRTLAGLRARAAAVHRDLAALTGAADLDLVLEWDANHRHAAVSWDSRLARPALLVGGHDLAAPDAPVRVAHALRVTKADDGRHRVVCEGRVEHDLPVPGDLTLHCAALLRPGDLEPLAAGEVVLRDMSPQTSSTFALDLGTVDLRPTVAAVRARHAAGDLAVADATRLADLDDQLATLDAAAALGFSPPAPPSPLRRAHARAFVHAAPRLAAPADLDVAPDGDRRTRALAELLTAHAARHHGGRAPPIHLTGTRRVIRRGRVE